MLEMSGLPLRIGSGAGRCVWCVSLVGPQSWVATGCEADRLQTQSGQETGRWVRPEESSEEAGPVRAG